MLNRAVGPLGELANRARSPPIPVAGHLDYRVGRGRHRGSLPGAGDPRGRHARALAIRASLAGGYDPLRLADARDPNPSPALFDLTDLVHRHQQR